MKIKRWKKTKTKTTNKEKTSLRAKKRKASPRIRAHSVPSLMVSLASTLGLQTQVILVKIGMATTCWYHWTLKRLKRYLVVPGLMIEWSLHGGSHVGQKHVWEKTVLKLYFSLTVNSEKYAVLPRQCLLLTKDIKENCQKILNLS